MNSQTTITSEDQTNHNNNKQTKQAAVLLPCRHCCACERCLHYLTRCPVCRAPFSKYLLFDEAEEEGEEGVERGEEGVSVPVAAR